MLQYCIKYFNEYIHETRVKSTVKGENLKNSSFTEAPPVVKTNQPCLNYGLLNLFCKIYHILT